MKKLLILSFLLLLNSVSYSQQISGQDVLPNTNSTDSTAILNNQLRLNQNAINAIGGYFGSNGALSPASGGTGQALANHVIGGIYYDDGSNFFKQLADGTSGYVLTANGAGVAPSYQVIPTPTIPIGYSLVSSTALSSASDSGQISLTNGHFYKVVWAFTSTNNSAMNMKLNNDSGANYKWSVQSQTLGTSVGLTTTKATGDTSFNWALGLSSGSNDSYFDLYIYPGPHAGFVYGTAIDSGGPVQSSFFGKWTGAATAFNFFAGSGTFNGTIYLYELKTS